MSTSSMDMENLSPIKRALLELREMKAKLDTLEQAAFEPIAITGIGLRFPGGASDLRSFWQLLAERQDAIIETPPERWDVEAYYDPDPAAPGKMYARGGGFLLGIDQFDPYFFGISPREAHTMDPQQRLLLEVSWEALENAGYAPDRLKGSQTGVYVGLTGIGDYGRLLISDLAQIEAYMATGNGDSVAAGRLAYTLGLHGPAVVVDTACSSSLLSVHLACQSLRNQEIDLALAGGVNVVLSPEGSVALSKMQALSPDSRCKTFDAAADGYVRGEGCGMIVLKRLSDARAAGDTILALIRGSAVNQDGRSSGLTAPNGPAQAAVIRQALANAHVSPAKVHYVETHGTGTPLGDPIEVQALMAVYGKERPADRPLVIGSVKTNIGHLEGAAGIAGLIKTVLALRHGTIPPHLHFHTPNPHIAWESSPVVVGTAAMPWPQDAPKFAGLSSFGFSGTNAHMILEAAPATDLRIAQMERPLHLLALSAKDETALQQLSNRYRQTLAESNVTLADICYTANTGRTHMNRRLALVAGSAAELVEKLATSAAGRSAPGVARGEVSDAQDKDVVFLFTGQGSQAVGMGRELYETQPVFRDALDECDRRLRPYLDHSLIALLYSGDPNLGALLDETQYTQPALFAVEYALAQLWIAWGVQPAAVLGHSVGEVVAACVAGVFSLGDALALIAQRARLMQALPKDGMMAAVFAHEARLTAALAAYSDQVSIAAVNGPQHIVISGSQAAVEAVLAELAQEGIRTQRLNVSHAFHSPLMAPMLDPFERAARAVDFHTPQIPLISNLTGEMLGVGQIPDANYWREHVRRPVRFAAGMETLQRQGYRLFLEIGPAPILLGMGRDVATSPNLHWLPSLRKKQSAWHSMLESLAALYTQGVDVDWAGFDRPYPRVRVVGLPTYPFQRGRYWLETARGRQLRAGTVNGALDGATDHQPPPASDALRTDWLYSVKWEAQAHLPNGNLPVRTQGHWLIFADRHGIGRDLAQRLRHAGMECILVVSQGAPETDEAVYALDPADPAGYDRLLETAWPQGAEPWRGIVHLWSLDGEPSGAQAGAPDAESLTQAQANRCSSVLHLVQALARRNALAGQRLWLVTRNAQAEQPGDPVAPEQAPLWGLAQTLGWEHPELAAICVDVDPAAGEALATRLYAEVTAPSRNGETRVLLRGDKRYVARLISSPIQTDQTQPRPLRDDAAYLITGGFGGLGLAVAQWMVEQGAKHLVLMGRSGASSPAAQQAVNSLTQAGANVIIAKADISRRDDVAQVLADVTRAGLALAGVIHAAGVLDDGVLLHQQWERFEKVMAPKVKGAWHLHELTRAMDLDFFVLFSSIASVLGAPGQGNYAAANAFLDALAHARRSQGLPALSINWGPWAEVGMAARVEERNQQRRRQLGLEDILPADGVRLFAALLASDAAQVAVLPMDWPSYLQSLAGTPPPLFTEMARRAQPSSPAVSPPLLQGLAQTPAARHPALVRAFVQDQARTVLGWDAARSVDPRQPLNEVGLDSLMAVELRNLISRGVNRLLPATLLFDYPTIDALADYLLQEALDVSAPPSPTLVPAAAAETRGQPDTEPIAIVGMGLRFPGGASDPERFWQLLRDGGDAITPIPSDRWDIEAFYSPDPTAPGKMITRGGGFLEHIDLFEPHFFGISAREAMSMDPQQRLLLEVTWEALEHAGQAPDQLKGSATGVFVGISNSDYSRLLTSDPETIDVYSATGTSFSVAAGRLAYVLGLQGPCMALDTACSSSLLAVHLACRSLHAGECSLALAGGVNLILGPEANINLTQAQMMASDDRCKTFDAAADGYVRSEGCAMIVLKRLSDARAAGDTIMAVVRGSAVNQDGRSNGLTAPNGPAQQSVLQQALTRAELLPSQVDYVETHGTGTPLGDPIEVQAVAAVYSAGRNARRPLWIGSVKTNLGHLESAAGAAALIKTVLALQHRQIPPHLHFHTPNPHIAWEQIPLAVPTQLTPWPERDTPRRAGVSSFGFSGTNVHMILEEAPKPQEEPSPPSRRYQLLALSAAGTASLTALAGQMAQRLAQPELDAAAWADFCYSAGVGRAHLDYRLAVVAESPHQAQTQLAEFAAGRLQPGMVYAQTSGGRSPAIAFLCTGQGAQRAGMGRELYASQPVFRSVMDRCAHALGDALTPPLLDVLYGDDETTNALLHETAYTQPALYAVEAALIELWRSWGVEPALLLGHSIGEFVAAYAAGVFSLEDGLKLVAARGQLMQALPRAGAMVVILADAATVSGALASYADQVSIAAINGPQQVVISGAQEAVSAVVEALTAAGVDSRPLQVSHAFHSPLMQPMVAAFGAVAAAIPYRAPRVPLVSNVYGRLFGADEIPDAAYWMRHVSAPVQFADGMQEIAQQGCAVVLEIGPQPVLVGLGRACIPAHEAVWPASLKRGREEWAQMLESLAQLYTQGVSIHWPGLYAGERRTPLRLPTYPFDRRRYWVEQDRPARPRPRQRSAAKQAQVEQWFYLPAWQRQPLPPEAAQPQAANAKQSWLICLDERGLGQQIAAQLTANGHSVLTVQAGDRFAHLGDGAYTVATTQAGSYADLLAELAAAGRLPDKAVYLWGLDATAPDVESGWALFGAVYLARALNSQALTRPTDLYLITRGAHEVTGEETLTPEQALMLGLAPVISQEHSNLRCQTIDLAWPKAGRNSLEPWARRLVQEMRSPTGEATVAYRGPQLNPFRWVQRYTPSPWPAGDTPRLRQEGVYLITGGLGGIGFVLASRLAQEARAKLVLTGRTTLPLRDQWQAWVAEHGGGDAISLRIRRVEALEALGAEVWVAGVDAGDERQMRALIEQIDRRFGGLHGVIHAAGVIGMTPLHELAAADWQAQIRAKVRGAQMLDRVLRDRPLDFCLMMSSLSAILGGLGFGVYAAANAYLDAYARHMRREGNASWISVNWDTWQSDEQAQWNSGIGAGLMELSMQPEEGIEVFRRILTAQDGPQVVVSVGDLQARLERWVTPGAPSTQDASPVLPLAQAARTRPSLSNAYVEPETEVQQQIAGIWHGLLGIQPIGLHDNFFELGGDSLLATQVISRLRATFQAELPVRTLFEAMTVAQLAEVLETTRLAAQMLRPRSSHPDAERGPAPERAPLAERESPVEREPVEREEVEL